MHPTNGPAAQPAAAGRQQQKVCGVCGERAKSHHFGGMACDSCKAFFRRSVQSEACNHFRCSYDGCCHITISSRKCCQFCRFQKCLKIGMEKKWVMSEEERVLQDKIRKERKRQRKEEEESRKCRVGSGASGGGVASPVQPPAPFKLSEQDREEIDQLVKKFYDSYSAVPLVPETPTDSQPPTTTRVVGVFVNAVSRLVSFIATLPHFRQIPQHDQKILLKNGVLAVLILRGTMVYDSSSMLFNTQAVGAKVGMSDIKAVMSPKLMENHRTFVERMQGLGLDKTTNMLLQMVVMFSSDLPGLIESETISQLQDYYTCLIRRYMCSIHGEDSTRILYPRMLHLLADLRALVEAHNMNTVCFPEFDMSSVVGEFSKMDLNPYPMWPDFCEKEKEQQQQQQLQQQQQHGQQGQAAHNEWRRQSLPDPTTAAAAISSGTNCAARSAVPRLGPPWPAHCPLSHSSAGASPHFPHAALGVSPQCPQMVTGNSPQTPDFRSMAGPQCVRSSPPSGAQFGGTAGAQCMRGSPPAGAQYSPVAFPGGFGCNAQADSPSPGAAPAHWSQWGSESFDAAAANGAFGGDVARSQPSTAPRSPLAAANCHRLPPLIDPTANSLPDLDLNAILELGPSLQTLEQHQKLAAEAGGWSPPPPTAAQLQHYHPHHQQQQQHQQQQLQQHLQQQHGQHHLQQQHHHQQQQRQQQLPLQFQQSNPLLLQHPPQFRTSRAGNVPGSVFP